jgi:broad specificity phosphatase PhoE/HD superfamily phosphohydrolase YqeK
MFLGFMVKTAIFLLRHGETQYNAEKRIQGQTQNVLNPNGKKQAQELKKFFDRIPIDAVYSSPLKRALQTASIVFPKHEIRTDAGLREREYGILEGMKWEIARKKYPKELAEYEKTRDLRVAGAESTEQVQERARKATQKIVKENRGKRIAIVGHGFLNKALLAALLGWPKEKLATTHQFNAAVNELVLQNRKWKLLRTNSTDHLESKQLPVHAIEKAVRAWESKTDFKSHDFLHVKRVAVGAKWFAKELGMNQYQQGLSYIAGLVHDLGRPKTEKVDHTESSVRLAEKLLKRFDLNKQEMETILELVESHRIGKSEPEKQVVFLADKLWEQMGAYVIFRRGIFVKEVTDYKDWDLREAFMTQHNMRIKRFYPALFPKRFQKLAQYQFKWAMGAGKAIEKKEPWILELVNWCAKNAEKKGKTIDGIIKSFNPTHKQGKRYQKEANLYITGERVKRFEGLVKK